MSNATTPVAAPADLVELGRITGAYGVKGWIKIQPHSADADVLLSVVSASSAKSSTFVSASIWWLNRPMPSGASVASGKSLRAQPYVIKAARPHSSHIVAQLDGIDDRDQAEALRGMTVCMPRSAFPAPDEDEYYWVDLIGCTVFGEENGAAVLLGVVDEVLDNGAHAVLKVYRQRPSMQGQGAGSLASHQEGQGTHALFSHQDGHGVGALSSRKEGQGAGAPSSLQVEQGAELIFDAKGRPIEVLVPFVQAHIRAVDLASRRIDSDWPLDF